MLTKIRKSVPWITSYSLIFETAFWKEYDNNNVVREIIDAFDDSVKHDPYTSGEKHINWLERQIFVYESPSLVRLPKVRVLYEIIEDEDQVIYHAFCVVG